MYKIKTDHLLTMSEIYPQCITNLKKIYTYNSLNKCKNKNSKYLYKPLYNLHNFY